MCRRLKNKHNNKLMTSMKFVDPASDITFHKDDVSNSKTARVFNEFSDLEIGDKITNNDLQKIFKCGPQGGMRKSNITNTLVLVTDQTRSAKDNPYVDKWIDNIFHYTGMGLKGNQSVSFMQNKTLSNLDETNTKAFLFEKKSKNCYTFLGPVKLHDNYYFEQQSDSEGHIRVVVKFPLEIIE